MYIHQRKIKPKIRRNIQRWPKLGGGCKQVAGIVYKGTKAPMFAVL